MRLFIAQEFEVPFEFKKMCPDAFDKLASECEVECVLDRKNFKFRRILWEYKESNA